MSKYFPHTCLSILVLIFGVPYLAHAQTIFTFVETIITIINAAIVPLLLAIAFIVFIFGVFKYFIAGGDDETARSAGRNLIIYGLIGFFVIITVWGLVNVLILTFEPALGPTDGPFNVPQAPTDSSGGGGSPYDYLP